MTSVTLRQLEPRDYDDLVALWRAARLPFRPKGRDRRDRIEAEMASGRSLFLGAVAGGALVGAVVATDDGRRGWINRLAVRPDARRQGVARALVAAAEAGLEARGLRIFSCLIERENAESLDLFRGLGYGRHDEIVYHAKRLDPDA